jgi:hypothetical protein
MARSLHESFDTAYKGGRKAARRTALRREDRLTVAEALEAMVEDAEPAEVFGFDPEDWQWWVETREWFCACSGHTAEDPVTGEPLDDRWGRCQTKGGGWWSRNVITGELRVLN